MNRTLAQFARQTLKENLALCNAEQQLIFKRMYSYDDLDLPINEVVENMPDEKLDRAMQQVEKTLSKVSS